MKLCPAREAVFVERDGRWLRSESFTIDALFAGTKIQAALEDFRETSPISDPEAPIGSREVFAAGYLAANPVASVQRVRSKKAKPKVRAMTREQRDRLLNETPEPYRALFALMAFSGLRPGEAYALKPSDLDLEMGIVRVERSVSIHDQSIKGTKTNEERDVELSDQTVAGMKTHLWLNDTVIRESGYLFSSEAGSILDHNNVAASIALGVSLMRNGRHR